MNKEQIEKLIEVLEVGRDAAHEVAQRFHEEMKGYREAEHKQVDKDVADLNEAIAMLEAEHSLSAQDRVPDTSQDWEKLDGAQAFQLIERHADDWTETGNMMESWLAARLGAAAPSPAVAVAGEKTPSSIWYVRQLRYENRNDSGEDMVMEVYKEGQGEERIEVRTQKPASQNWQFAVMLARALTAWEGNEKEQFTIAEINLFRQWFDNVEDLNQKYLELADYELAKKLYPICGCRWSDRSEEHRKKLLNQSMR